MEANQVSQGREKESDILATLIKINMFFHLNNKESKMSFAIKE